MMHNFILVTETILVISLIVLAVMMVLDLFTSLSFKYIEISFWATIVSYHVLIIGVIILMIYYGGGTGGYHGGYFMPMKIGGMSQMMYIGY